VCVCVSVSGVLFSVGMCVCVCDLFICFAGLGGLAGAYGGALSFTTNVSIYCMPTLYLGGSPLSL